MTRPSAVSRNDYVGTGTTGPFPYAFPVLAVSDLRVIKRSAATGTETVLSYPADWTTTDIFPVVAGSITLTTALATGDVLTVRRGPALTQLTSFRSQGSFSPAIHEDAFDHTTDEIQSNADAIARTPKLKESYNPALYSLDFAPGSTGQVLGWNGTALGPLGPPVSTGVTLPAQARTVASLTAYLANNSDFNVLDYGADPTGVADSSAAIQAAIDQAAVATIGMVRVTMPKGTYKLANGITLAGGVILQGAGGPSDTDGGFATVPRTTLNYTKTSGIAVTLLGTATQGHKNIHLRDFYLLGTANADGGILVGSGAGSANQVNQSSIRNVTVAGFTKAGAYGFSFRRMLTSIIENCIAIGNTDGFKFPSDAVTTTLTFLNCHAYSNRRNGLRVDGLTAAQSMTSCNFYDFVAESNDQAGVYLDGAQFVNFYNLYCEANCTVSGVAPVMLLGTSQPSRHLHFYTPTIITPIANRSFDFVNVDRSVIYYPTLVWASTGWCSVTAATTNCAAILADDLSPGTVTNNNTGRMAIQRPFARSVRDGAQAGVTDGGTIAHGLGVIPVLAKVQTTVAGEFASVTALDITNITVAIKKDTGAAGTSQTIYWEAKL